MTFWAKTKVALMRADKITGVNAKKYTYITKRPAAALSVYWQLL